MSKRTTTARNSPPSLAPIHKKRKMDEDGRHSMIEGPTTEPDIISLLKGLPNPNSSSTGLTQSSITAQSPQNKSSTISQEANGWTRVEKRKEKKAKKTAEKAVNQPPSLAFNVQELVKIRTVPISDVRELALHLTGHATPPSWLRITNRASIQRTVVLLVPGITHDVFSPPLKQEPNTANPLLHVPAISPNKPASDGSQSKLPFLSTFLHAVPTKAPGDAQRMYSVLHGFFMGPVTGEEKKRRIMERIKDERETLPPVTSYLLTQQQFVENEYPLPVWMEGAGQLGDDWLQFPRCPENAPGKVLGLDCEMCITTAGKELTHICIVDYETGEKVYDELVLPSAPITDYLTRFSGISPTSLENTRTTLADVHAALAKLITPTTILLGHSLESDLRAMKVAHGRCIDTSVIYHHPRGRPLKPGLKWLMKKWANKDIQTRGEGGHDPEEDARACIDLLKLKVRNGKGFGLFMVDVENVLERMGRGGRVVKTAVVDYGKPSTWLGSKATSTVACGSDEDVVNGIKQMVDGHQFVFGRMLELSEGLGWTAKKNPPTRAMSSPPPTPFQDATVALEPTSAPIQSKTPYELYQSLNENLTEIYKSLPSATAFILLSGHGDPRKMSELSMRKAAFEAAIREGKTPADIPKEEWWTTQDGRLLEDEVEKAKYGLLFLGIK